MLITPGTSFELAEAFVNKTKRNILLTGKAGTGKTTFLKHIRSTTLKTTMIAAPTGVAAINANGNTIHSLFSLPFHPFVPAPQARHHFISTLKLSRERKELFQSLELLIIDEVSMVRCDVLDAIDLVLRSSRSAPNKPFGGVQVLLIGDLYQLPPVVRSHEWDILNKYYSSPFFFNAHALKDEPLVYIELDTVFRQKDPRFISLLNQVRNNEVDKEHYDLLHDRLRAHDTPVPENYITLTTHNHLADEINQKELSKLSVEQFTFQAKVTGTFSSSSFPADESLQLKTGARVMFLKNDTEKKYFNGKTGIIKSLGTDEIVVTVQNELTENITVKKEEWKNTRYSINRSSGKMEEEELGSFSQFPLRLAWAITIHKSQGLTFDNVLIDAGSAFAPGQVYVALSRCRTLEGIYLATRISTTSLQSDPHIVSFIKSQKDNSFAAARLKEEGLNYEKQVVNQLFSFVNVTQDLKAFKEWVKGNEGFKSDTVSWAENIFSQISEIEKTAEKFRASLDSLWADPSHLQQRIKAAAVYFSTAVKNTLPRFNESPALVDNRKLAGDYNEKANDIFLQLSFLKHNIDSCQEGFTLSDYLLKRSQFRKPNAPVNAYDRSGGPVNSGNELYHLLIKKRNELADAGNRPRYLIISSEAIKQMSEKLPVTLEQLATISGFGKVKLTQFGKIFIEIIIQYCDVNGIVPEGEFVKVKKAKNTEKSPSGNVSLQLLEQGKSIKEIATERKLTVATIEGHLLPFVQSGNISIDKIVNEQTIKEVSEALSKKNTSNLTELKQLFPDVSYGELRLVIAHTKQLQATV